MRRRWALALVAGVLGVAGGCGKSLGDLGEFPCAKDGTCPTGYFCGLGEAGSRACLASCTLGGDCGSGRDCKWDLDEATTRFRGVCFETGSKGGTDPREAACALQSECAEGYGCWSWGSTEAFCHRLCDASHSCGLGDQCLTDTRFTGASGVCGCELFGPGCGSGRSCIVWGQAATGLYTACSTDGPRSLGQTCGSAEGYCQHNLECWTQDSITSYCRALCDQTHPCPSGGGSCRPLSFLFDGAGICLP